MTATFSRMETMLRGARWLKSNTDVLTLLVLAVGLIFALIQARDLKRSIDASNWNAVAGQWLDMDKIFVDHADLRKYIYEGEALPSSDDERDRALAVATYVLDFIDNALITGHNIEDKTITHIGDQTEYFDKLIASKSPAICAVFNRDREAFSDHTNALLAPHCQVEK